MFYTRLINLCELKGITITALTAANGISKGNVTRWKNGSIPNGDTLIKLADYFDCSIDYLLGRTDSPELRQVVVDEELSYHTKKDSPNLTSEEITKLKNFLDNLKE